MTSAITCFVHCSYEYDDPRIKKQIEDFKTQYEIIGTGLIADYIPSARYIPLPQVARVKNFLSTYYGRIQAELDEHRKSFNPGMVSSLQPLIKVLYHTFKTTQ